MNFRSRRPKLRRRGFTLIETLVAVSLFSVLMIMTVGSLTILIDANRKARSEKAVINNLNATMEIISRSMRDGSGQAMDCWRSTTPILPMPRRSPRSRGSREATSGC
jgi:prepilin-type N-terminal cleavage/methylation domain-containing protein